MIVCLIINGIHALLQIVDMILVRNNNGYKRFFLPLINCVVHAVKLRMLHARRDTGSPVVCLDRLFSGLKCIQLALRVTGCGFLVAAPVIQHLRNMTDFLCALGAAEDKVIVLGTVKLVPEAAHLI